MRQQEKDLLMSMGEVADELYHLGNGEDDQRLYALAMRIEEALGAYLSAIKDSGEDECPVIIAFVGKGGRKKNEGDTSL